MAELKSNAASASSADRRSLPALAADESGSVLILFGVVFMVAIGAVGLAVDYLRLHSLNGELQAAADSAALSATAQAMAVVAARGLDSDRDIAAAKSRATTAAKRTFLGNAKGKRAKSAVMKVDAAIQNHTLSVGVQYAGAMPTVFGRIFGFNAFQFAGNAKAVANLPPFVDIHVLVDTSGSMAIGASVADQNLLRAETGCAFACHDGVPVKGYADAYAYATGTGVTLRYTAVNNGIVALLDAIDREDKSSQFVRTAVYSIDDVLKFEINLTADTSKVRKALPKAPVISSEAAGATKFNDNIGALLASIGPGGDGSSPSKAVKLLMIATDGVEDPGRAWTHDVALRAKVDAFNMSFCEFAKASDVTIGIIHTPYIKMPWDWGYEATLGQPSQQGGAGDRVDDIAPALKACAGSRYVEAHDQAAIESAFTSIFNSLSAVRLTQ